MRFSLSLLSICESINILLSSASSELVPEGGCSGLSIPGSSGHLRLVPYCKLWTDKSLQKLKSKASVCAREERCTVESSAAPQTA
ncbi:hypothetical protein COCOBI_13-2620 [Coccomyxa sp. Obi]|nr:hypothetical protein COCOBI_13-2620 [Coccomyxa sp. Obi]